MRLHFLGGTQRAGSALARARPPELGGLAGGGREEYLREAQVDDGQSADVIRVGVGHQGACSITLETPEGTLLFAGRLLGCDNHWNRNFT